MRRRLYPFVIVHAALALTACKAEDCDPGIAEGEPFQFAIIEKTSTEGINCEAGHPEFLPGDSFILEGGHLFEPGHSQCDAVRAAKPDAPAPWSDEVHECDWYQASLGQECSWKDGCGGFIYIYAVADFPAGKPVEDGEVVVKWSKQPCAGNPGISCTEHYAARIERL